MSTVCWSSVYNYTSEPIIKVLWRLFYFLLIFTHHLLLAFEDLLLTEMLQVEKLRKLAIVIDFNFGVDFVIELESFQTKNQIRWKLFDSLNFFSFHFFVTFFAVIFIASIKNLSLY